MVRKANPKSKDCYNSICASLKRKGIQCDTIDIRGLTDSKRPCSSNKKDILKAVASTIDDDYGRYNQQYSDFQHSYGKSKVKKVCNPPVKVKAHCRKGCKIKVKSFKRACPTKKYR